MKELTSLFFSKNLSNQSFYCEKVIVFLNCYITTNREIKGKLQLRGKEKMA